MYSVKKTAYSFWDLLKITFNSINQLLWFLKINFKWVLDYRKCYLKVKIVGNEDYKLNIQH